jgi:argininosuccinate lyase
VVNWIKAHLQGMPLSADATASLAVQARWLMQRLEWHLMGNHILADAKALGFAAPMRNSMDAVSARDFVLEMLAASSICAIHLSRLAEEIVFWCSAQFRFVTLSDKFTTGSSIMPQKRNPDAAELVRAKPGRILGAFMALSVVIKGLPLTYSKDMQEDKEPAFDAIDALALAIAATEGMVRDMKANAAEMHAAAANAYATATDLADWLVQELGLPFREAHHITGRIVALAERRKLPLDKLPLSDLQGVHAGIDGRVYKVLSVEHSVAQRKSLGGTAPTNVKREASRWLKQLKGRKP